MMMLCIIVKYYKLYIRDDFCIYGNRIYIYILCIYRRKKEVKCLEIDTTSEDRQINTILHYTTINNSQSTVCIKIQWRSYVREIQNIYKILYV